VRIILKNNKDAVRHSHEPAAERVKARDELAALVKELKKKGKKIVLTNGCFDLLHVGHLHTFEQAKRCGDILIVALNSDVSVRSLKGAERPFVPERERAVLLAGLRAVDFVVIFDELDPLAIVTELLPDVLVKGEDWLEGTIIGQDVVESAGGRVVRVPLIEGTSTTRLINKIQAAASRQ